MIKIGKHAINKSKLGIYIDKSDIDVLRKKTTEYDITMTDLLTACVYSFIAKKPHITKNGKTIYIDINID